ncbi:MAG: hypothetical protein RIR51_667 [Bacteroidota bacterium]|jgi:ATP-dependent Lon protease
MINIQAMSNMKDLLGQLSGMEKMELVQVGMQPEPEDIDIESLSNPLSILPVKNMVLFPGVVVPITITRQSSIKLVKKVQKGNKLLGVVSVINPSKLEPNPEEMYHIGTVAKIIKMFVLPGGNISIIVQGIRRFEIEEFTQLEPYYISTVKYWDEEVPSKFNKEDNALISSVKETAKNILELASDHPREVFIAIETFSNLNTYLHFISSNLINDLNEKQNILATPGLLDRCNKLLQLLVKELKHHELKKEIQIKASSDIDQQQRDYYLRQQIKVLQEELGQETPEQEMDTLRLRASKKKWTAQVSDFFNKEINKLSRMNSASPEYPSQLNFVELLLDLPWGESTKESYDIRKAKRILDADHNGLEKVKERILEYLSVIKFKGNLKAPILCLVGPPGVGKTSLGKSIAKAVGRKYVRMALGGLQDEAEIRGHRKTYIGAMPGKIIQNLKKAGSNNPVFVLDEIDKLGNSHRGDPSSALLEVLDPEQNNSFLDNYLDVEYDLSNVMFIATANSLDTVPGPLRDRMEIIEVSGYTLEEKVQIAKKHLFPKQIKEHGLEEKGLKIKDKTFQKLIGEYTRESGVRKLEQEIARLVRKFTLKIAMEEDIPAIIEPSILEEYLGPAIFHNDEYEKNDIAGIVTGLAWTSVGGDILFIESLLSKGKGNLVLSGQLGDVMKESAQAALTFLKAHHEDYGIDFKLFEKYNLHIHVPAGAVPKDGPSAGITMLTSIASVLTQRQVRDKLAMTGEITLRGKVLPVGGIKEKILAAKRAGIKEIILSQKNQKDILEIEPLYLKDLKFHYVDNAKEVLEIALLKKKVKNSIEFSLN